VPEEPAKEVAIRVERDVFVSAPNVVVNELPKIDQN
jgi:hypothetical protein